MLIRPPSRRAAWAAHAKRGDQILPLHPRYFPHVYGSQHEMEQVLVDRVQADADFARRFEGWQFFCVDISRAIEVRRAPQHAGQGSIVMIGNQKEEL